MSTRKKNGTGVRLALDKTSKSRDKDLQDVAGDENQDTEDNHAEDHDVFEDQEPPPSDDMVSLQKQFAKLQKQFAPCVTIKAYFPATESRDTKLGRYRSHLFEQQQHQTYSPMSPPGDISLHSSATAGTVNATPSPLNNRN
jgi:hypothetical protein